MGSRAEEIQVEDELYGERSAGIATLATSRTGVDVRDCGGKSGHGPEDSAKVPAGSAPAKRDATKAYVANTTGSVRGCLGADSATAYPQPGLQAKTLFQRLQEAHPGRFSNGQVRTLRRRMSYW